MLSAGDWYAITCGLVWSFAVILMRIAGFTIPPLALTFFKSLVAVLGFVVVLFWQGGPWVPDLPAMSWTRLVLSAIFGIAIADTLFAAALNRLGASLQALADCIYAPSIAMVGFLMFGEGLSAAELLGGAVVISGVFVGFVKAREIDESRDLVTGVFLAAGAHVIMAVGILVVRDVIQEGNLVWIAGFRFSVATAALGLFLLAQGDVKSLMLGIRRYELWRFTVPMAILGPFLATLLWIAGFKYETPGRVAIFNQLSTVFVVLWAWLILKEPMTRKKIAGVTLAFGGAVLVAWG